MVAPTRPTLSMPHPTVPDFTVTPSVTPSVTLTITTVIARATDRQRIPLSGPGSLSDLGIVGCETASAQQAPSAP